MAPGPAPHQPYGASGPGVPGGPVTPGGPVGREPSLVPMWIGVAVLVVGIGGASIWMFSAVLGVINRVNQMPRYEVPVDARVSLEAGTYFAYAEYPHANTDSGPADAIGPITVTDQDRQPVSVDNAVADGGNETYSFGGHVGRVVASFEIDQSGTYVVQTPHATQDATGGQTVRLALSKGRAVAASGVIWAVFGSLGIGALSLLVGLVLLIVTLTRRSRWRRDQALAGGPWWPPGPGGHGGPGGSGGSWSPGAPGSAAGPGPTTWAPPVPPADAPPSVWAPPGPSATGPETRTPGASGLPGPAGPGRAGPAVWPGSAPGPAEPLSPTPPATASETPPVTPPGWDPPTSPTPPSPTGGAPEDPERR